MRKSLVSTICVLAVVTAIAGCKGPCHGALPPAQMLMEPGPGVGGPGPGVTMYQPAVPTAGRSSQVAFVGPEGMAVAWDVGAPGLFDSEAMICPGRENFPQGAIYRLKMTNVPGRPGVELYPTLEVGPAMPRTEAFLAHNPIPVQFTEEDFDQVLSGNFITKVIYLPDAEFQELALAGVETLVSTRLDPGVDPIIEADRRGAILAIVRLGNIDLEIPSDMLEEGGVIQASYVQGAMMQGAMMQGAMMQGAPMGVGMGGGGMIPSHYISGVTAPQYGMPMSGTPIGLPGPPHVPLGIPAGLQKHVMKNHTRVRVPGPTEKFTIDVKQSPGLSYPKPVSGVKIREKAYGGGLFKQHQPLGDKFEVIKPGCQSGACEIPCETPYAY